jgi:hypothetical protein
LRKVITIIICCFICLSLYAQKNASVSGRVLNEDDRPFAGVSVQILNSNKGIATNDSGYFVIHVEASRSFALVFSFTGYKTVQKNFLLNKGEEEKVTIKLERAVSQLKEVTVTDSKVREQTGLINVDPTRALVNPSPLGNIESLIKVFVGSNNELTSQYSVRGGNYDENLVYVNDFEIFRPYLVKSGQQEGLSFINPELTSGVRFYNGGYQARYGDKMSSVLDITYKKPTQNGGSAYIGLLEQGLHLEGVAHKQKVTYLFGVRNRTNKSLLSSQSTQGSYIPSSADAQGLLTWQVSNHLRLEALGNYSQTRFTLYPEENKLTASSFSPLYPQSLEVNIDQNGREKDKYSTGFVGLTAIHDVNKNLRLKWMLSYFEDNERENMDIVSSYTFGELNIDENSSSFGNDVNPLGKGVYQDFSRNSLYIRLLNAQHKGSLDAGKHYLQWGNAIEQQTTRDRLNTWHYNDSAGYSLPYTSGGDLALSDVYKGNADLNITRFSGYLQDNIRFKDSADFVLQAGVRYNYNTLNKEFLVSPRIGFSFKPVHWQKDVVLKGSVGIYDQPPFYRELRRYDGSLNKDVKAQKSWQAVAGMDYSFKMFDRPARFTTEAYYKNMTDVNPYDIENVRIRYYGTNNAKAYAYGIEGRLFGEIVKDAESWVSLGFMRTRENLDNDTYATYYNKEGEVINSNSKDKVVADSSVNEIGWLRRPTDRLITFGMFFQDYLSTNKNIKVYFNTIYGSNLPYNIPGSTRYRNALEIPSYIRVDIGFSALLLDAEKQRRSHSPFRSFKNIWASLEIFNLIDHPNTISYLLIKDYQNNIFALPNRLTPRLLNFKIVANW